MWIVFLSVGFSVIASLISTMILATHYFVKMDGYVKEMCNMTMSSNDTVLTTIRKLQQSSVREE